MTTLRQVVNVVETLYPLRYAESLGRARPDRR